MSEDEAISNTGPWRCFHCGELFADRQPAEDHFGLDCLYDPACIQLLTETERAIVEDRRLWRDRALKAESENESLGCQLSGIEWDIRSKFKRCRTLSDVFFAFDEMEGRALAAEEKLGALNTPPASP